MPIDRGSYKAPNVTEFEPVKAPKVTQAERVQAPGSVASEAGVAERRIGTDVLVAIGLACLLALLMLAGSVFLLHQRRRKRTAVQAKITAAMTSDASTVRRLPSVTVVAFVHHCCAPCTHAYQMPEAGAQVSHKLPSEWPRVP
jgi:hypothetical protein